MDIILENSEVVAKIKSLGAELVSFKDVKTQKEYMWRGEVWKKTSPVLFPVIGSLIDGGYTLNGNEYAMAKHGFAQGVEFEMRAHSENFVHFVLKSSEESLKIFPFEFEFSLIYTLKGRSLNVEYRVENRGSEVMIFSVGGHPGFACPLDSGRTIDGYFIEFEKEETTRRYPVDGMYISRTMLPGLEKSKKMFLSKTIFENDAWIFKNLKSDYVKIKNIYDHSEIKIGVKGFEYLAFWSKPGAAYVCVEPWCGIADFIGHSRDLREKEGVVFLEKDNTFSIDMPIEIN